MFSLSLGRGPGRGSSNERALQHSFELEQFRLAPEPSGVSREAAVGADHAVARHDDRERIAASGRTRGTRRAWSARARRQLRVSDRLAEGNARDRDPDTALEFRTFGRERQLEALALSLEVLHELARACGDRRRGRILLP